MTPEARKILKRWVAQDFYVYMRPMSAVYAGGKDPKAIHWCVSVEYRGVEWRQIRGEGSDLSKVVVEMSGRVPNRHREQPGYKPGKDTGWLAAKKTAKRQLKDMKEAREKAEAEKPKKKSKKSKKKVAK